MNFPRRFSPFAALVLVAGTLFAQTESSAMPGAQPAEKVSSPHQKPLYFSLEHRTADAMTNEDSALLQSSRTELVKEARFYGYDLATEKWTYDQTLCPELADTLLLHYLNKFDNGSESLFTALVPRNGGRIRVVPVLYRNATTYIPAVKSPRNFALFNSLVPAQVAKQGAAPEGKWLSFGVCYAEVVGGRPNVPNEPGLDLATIKAPTATLMVDAAAGERRIQFSDRDAQNIYKIWTVFLNQDGRVTGAINEDYATYAAHIVQAAVPASEGSTSAPPPPSRIIPPPADPPSKITHPVSVPN